MENYTAEKGLYELTQCIQCIDNYSARGYHRTEELTPQLAADTRSFVEPTTQAGSELEPVGAGSIFKKKLCKFPYISIVFPVI